MLTFAVRYAPEITPECRETLDRLLARHRDRMPTWCHVLTLTLCRAEDDDGPLLLGSARAEYRSCELRVAPRFLILDKEEQDELFIHEIMRLMLDPLHDLGTRIIELLEEMEEESTASLLEEALTGMMDATLSDLVYLNLTRRTHFVHRLRWDRGLAPGCREWLESVLERWGHLVPTWCHILRVSGGGSESLGEDVVAAMETRQEFRTARLHITASFLEAPLDVREATIVHELCHCPVQPLVDTVVRTIKEVTGNPIARDLLIGELVRAREAVVCDLTRYALSESGLSLVVSERAPLEPTPPRDIDIAAHP